MSPKSLMLNKDVALERVGGDEELLQEVARLFLSDCSRAMNEIRTAIDTGDAKRLEREAHSLKGSVSNFGAEPVVEAARELELMGRLGNLATAVQSYQLLETKLSALKPELEHLCE
jgi:HPt (histidine-containing phosphotransfer) domain-containing protein